jgi:phosphate/sulfate permease
VSVSLDYSVLLAPLLLVFGFAFGWNNSGLTTGNLSNLMNYRLALAVTIMGVLVGVLAMGQDMTRSIFGKLVASDMPSNAVVAAVAVSIGLLILLTMFRLPVSLSNCSVGSFIGAALASSTGIKGYFVVEITVSWFAAPLLCAVVTPLVYYIVVRLENGSSLVSVSLLNRVLLLSSVFYVSFALGANNVGMMVSLSQTRSDSYFYLEIAIFIATSLGMILFGKSIAKVVGDKIVGLSQVKTLSAMLGSALITTIFTILSVPLSLTQVIIGAMLGAGAVQRPSIINKMELSIMILGWALVTLASAGLAYLLTYFMLRF